MVEKIRALVIVHLGDGGQS